jgi:LacI family transcriptional regulator
VTTIYGVARVAGVSTADAPGAVARQATGFDDLYPSRINDPPQTTVSQPIHELGSRATHRLMARIASPGLVPRAEILPTRVVIRTSCGCPATGGLGRAAQSGPPPNRKEKPAWDST